MMTRDLDRIREALSFIPADDRDTWVKMGMAVKSELGGAGFDVWEAWSLQADSFNAKDARDVWKSIRGNGEVTAGTLFHEAKANGWHDDGTHQKPPPEELAERRRIAAERAAKEEAEIARERAEAAKKAATIWKAATPAAASHPYLSRKRVSPVATLREIDAGAAAAILGYAPKSGGDPLAGRLLAAPVKVGDTLSTLELIDGDGRKSAIAGGGKAGGYWAAQPLPEGDGEGLTLLIGEGVATALSAREATGHLALVALSCGNLEPVAKAMSKHYPAARLVLLADLGKGQAKAEQAARAVGGLVAVPDFGANRPEGATDFNELHQHAGLEAVRCCIEQAAPFIEKPEGREPIAGLVCAADIPPESITWLWNGWLAADVLHVLAGAPGTGKTTAALALAATITSGGRWPDSTQAEPGDVLIWSGEDLVSKTLVPRLLAMGADMRRVHFVETARDAGGVRPFDPATDMPQLQAAIQHKSIKPKLLIVDSIVSAVAGDSHKNSETRRALQPLVNLAEAEGCAVLGISHFSKGTAGRDVLERVTGSLAFGALARLVLATAKLPEEKGGGRLLARAKSNLGPDDGGYRYELRQVELPRYPGVMASCLLWGEAIEGCAREILAQAEAVEDQEERTQCTEAANWLQDLLLPERMKSQDVKRKAEQNGFAWRTVQRAAKESGVIIKREGFGPDAAYYWSLSSCAPKKLMHANTQSVTRMVGSGAHGEIERGEL